MTVDVGDVRIGATYRVRVPRRERPLDHRIGDPAYGPVDVALAWLEITHRRDFALTVTAIGAPDLGPGLGEPAVTGALVVDQPAAVVVPLPADVAAALALDPAAGYQVAGRLVDGAGDPVALPTEQTVTVPARWLHPSPGPVG